MKHITQIAEEYINYNNDIHGEIFDRIITTHTGKPTEQELKQGKLSIWTDEYSCCGKVYKEATTTYHTITHELN